MRITAIRCHSWGPAGYRVDMPMYLLRKAGHEVRTFDADQFTRWSPAMFAGWDVVVLQRQAAPQWVEMLHCIPEGRRPVLIYEIDDLLWGMAPEAHDPHLPANVANIIRRADAVTVSTPELAEEARKLNPRVFCVLNAIDFGRRDWVTRLESRPAGHTVVIGWAGSIRGPQEMQVMGTALRDTLADHPEACFAIGGDPEQAGLFQVALGLSEETMREQVYFLPPATFQTYPQMISAFDIGLAPLSYSRFNACKSELKIMEYSAMGVPWIASDIAPYRRFARLGGGGILAEEAADWRRALDVLLHEAKVRQALTAAGKAVVEEGYSLEGRSEEWERVMRAVARTDTPREVAYN